MTSHTLPPSRPLASVLGSMEYGAGARRRGGGVALAACTEAMLFTCSANIYVTALLAPTFDIGPKGLQQPSSPIKKGKGCISHRQRA